MGQALSGLHKTIDIQLWTIDLRRATDDAALSDDERARAARLVMPDARRRFVAARAGLREILSKYTRVEAAALTFSTGDYGKPALSGMTGAPLFNLAHSGDLALAAVSRAAVGVDLEQVRPLANRAQMADLSFTDEERAALWTLDEAAQVEAFFRLWTRKEAVMKAHGAGFRLAKNFSLLIRAEDAVSPAQEMVRLDGRLFSVREIAVAAGFVAAVAAEMDGPDVCLRVNPQRL